MDLTITAFVRRRLRFLRQKNQEEKNICFENIISKKLKSGFTAIPCLLFVPLISSFFFLSNFSVTNGLTGAQVATPLELYKDTKKNFEKIYEIRKQVCMNCFRTASCFFSV